MYRAGGRTVVCVGTDADAPTAVADRLEGVLDEVEVTVEREPDGVLAQLAGDPPDCLLAGVGFLEAVDPGFLEAVDDALSGRPVVAYGTGVSRLVGQEPFGSVVTDYVSMEGENGQYRVLANRVRNAVERVRARRQAENLDHLRRELSDIVVDFLKRPREAIDEQVTEALSRIGPLTDADRSYVFQIDGGDRIRNTHEWTAPEVEPQIEANQDFDPDSLPWLYPQLREFETVAVPAVAELPPEAATERAVFRAQNIQSTVIVPMIAGEKLVGFIGFDWLERRPDLSEAVVDVLEMVGESIANAIQWERKRAEIAASRNTYRELFDAIDDAVFVHGTDGTFLAVNETACERLGYTERELLELTPADIDAPEHAELAADRIERIEADGTHTFETVHVGKSGVHIPVEVAASTVEYFGESAILSVARDISERKRRTRELQQYKRAVEGSTELLGAVDEHHRLLFANERFRTVIGDDDPDPAGRHLQEYLGAGAYAEVQPHLERGLAGEAGQFERTHTTTEGEERALSVNYHPLESPAGEIEGVVVAIHDVTERRARERELAENLEEIRRLSEYRRVMSEVNQRLVEFRQPESVLKEIVRIIAESAEFSGAVISRVDDPPIWSFDSGGIEPQDTVKSPSYLEAVSEAGTLHVADVTESPYKLLRAEHPPTEGLGLDLSHEGEGFGALTVLLPPGETASSEAVELLEELAGDVGLFRYTQKIERDLREREERLDLALEGAELGVWDWDMRTDDVYRDPRYERMLGYEPGTIDGTVGGWAEILHPDARETHDRALEKHVEGEADLYQCEYRLRTADDEWKWIRNIGKILEWTEDGEPKRSVGVHQDIDEQRRTRERLQSNNELLQAIDRVLRHNLHNDLNVVQGYAQTIAESATDRIEYQAEKIVESSEALLETADKERRLTELVAERQTTDPVTLGPLLEGVADRVRARHPGATIEIEAPAGTTVLAIPQIGGAFEELLENGVRHTHNDEPTVRVQVEAGADAVTVDVIDDGPGIPQMERNVLTGQDEITPLYHGSGLGLWFVNIVVRRSDGEIAVEETGPDGSRLVVQLPRSS